jgi:pre-mRNA-splicing factor CDC5/CEF1
MIKGGVWKNSEDEILKAAVMKYGLNNWSRVASLLLRKSPKQCKARWYSWVDPHVKKTEWTREEEEKLLHLAKLFPCQWNTIAPIVGRTAYQCLEHYEKLLDQAQGGEDQGEDDPRRLAPGEIDPHPETKPARADPVDMDEDEKEMLSEARARLANTRGKKAKRKAREAQLEEARRLATLQKKRELKAAGIAPPRTVWKRKRGIDYANEIPFEQQPPAGFHATGLDEDPKANLGLANINLQNLEGARRDEEEKRNKKDDERKLKRLKEDNLPEYIEMINKMNDPANLRKRTGLALPTPQMSDAELDDLVRAGQQLSGISAEGDDSTKILVPSAATPMVGGASALPGGATPLRTPRAENTVLLAAADAAARNSLQTPLRGGETPNMNLDRATSAMPSSSVAKTPSLKDATGATPARTAGGVNATPQSTPARLFPGDAPEGKSSAVEKANQAMSVRAMLSSLPAPENEVEISMPDEPEVEAKDDDFVADQEEIEKAAMKKALEKQSKAVTQGLPRPLNPKVAQRTPVPAELEAASEQMFTEMQDIVTRDHILHPQAKKKTAKPSKAPPELEEFTAEEMKQARALLDEEMAELAPEDVEPGWEAKFIFVAQGEKGGEWMKREDVKPEVLLSSLSRQLDLIQKRSQKENSRVERVEKKLGLLLGGYMSRVEETRGKIADRSEECVKLAEDRAAFARLEELEKVAMARRVEELEDRVRAVQAKNAEAQTKYRALSDVRAKLEKCLDG